MAEIPAHARVMNSKRPWWQWWVAGGVVAALAGGTLLLYFFDPVTAGFFPVCPLHATTGLDCPGCGTLRAVHALTHGHLAAAWHFNAFFVLMLPVAAWLGMREGKRWLAGAPDAGMIRRPAFVWAAGVAVIAWGVARNLPGIGR